ncbi:MAG: amidohydrolase [Proteobacteria bacterium]|nr:amidohydrolase [Pseudomonadota bacterium]
MSDYSVRPKHIIDAHTHIFEEEYREKYIEDTFSIDFATELNFRRGADGTLDDLSKSADENGIAKYFILPVVKDPRKIERINDFYYNESKRDERAVFCGNLHPNHPRLDEILADLKSKNARMIKLHSVFQRFNITSRQSLKFFEKISDMGFPVIFDTSRVPPKHLTNDDLPEYYANPSKLLKLHDILPNLEIIAAHGGGLFIYDFERRNLIDSGIYIELSSSYYNCDWPRNDHDVSLDNFLYMLNNHNQEKLLFGTDTPWQFQKYEIEKFVKLHETGKITKEQLENIFWKNANSLFDLGLE